MTFREGTSVSQCPRLPMSHRIRSSPLSALCPLIGLMACRQCYICMDEAESEQDALIAPCLCKGSTALVHVRCLQRLLSTGEAHKVRPTNLLWTPPSFALSSLRSICADPVLCCGWMAGQRGVDAA